VILSISGRFCIIYGQDPSFSQFFANRLYFNPAWAGVGDESRRFLLAYRNQWPAVEKAFVSYNASYDQYIEPLHGGIGFRVMNDIQGEGTISQFNLSAIYSYQLQVNRSFFLNAGFEAGYAQRQMKAADFVFEDESEVYGNDKFDYPDIAIGIASFYKNFYGGISIAHILKPRISESSEPGAVLPRRYIVYTGAIIPVYERRMGKEVLQLSPNMIFMQQGSNNQINYGIEGLLNNQILSGIWVRQNLGIRFSSLIFSVGYVTNNFSLRYSYDHQLSSPTVKLPIMGAHEISLILTPEGDKKKKRRAIKCPKI
jgi:type IX secretion system PorP/SprF family membrane protein